MLVEEHPKKIPGIATAHVSASCVTLKTRTSVPSLVAFRFTNCSSV